MAIKDMSAEKLISKAIIDLQGTADKTKQTGREQPFFAHLLLSMKYKPFPTWMPPEKRSMGVDAKGNMYYDEAWVKSLSDDERIGVLCHEVLHVALLHHARMGGRNLDVSNIAQDMVVNSMVRKSGMSLPKATIPVDISADTSEIDLNGEHIKISRLSEKMFEEVYYEIMDKLKLKNKQNGGGGKGPKRFDDHIYGDGDKPQKDEKGNITGQGGQLSPQELSDLTQEMNQRLADAAAYCFDDKTEILTRDGWKLFKDVSKGEMVATLHTATKGLQFQPVRELIREEYSGKMVKIGDVSTDVMVTPNHRFFVKKGMNESFVRADSLGEDNLIPRVPMRFDDFVDADIFEIPQYESEWNSGKDSHIHKSYVKEKRTIPMNVFVELLGWFLSEGSCRMQKDKNGRLRGGRVCITQKKNIEQVRCLMKKLENVGFSCSEYVKSNGDGACDFYINDTQLADYFSRFGKSHDKFIPADIKNLPEEKLKILLEALILGDGHKLKRKNGMGYSGSVYYYTVSKRLADDVQEIALKSGKYAQVVYAKEGIYHVGIYENKKYYHVIAKDIRLEDYNGMIYCVTVPNEVILVRRNGKAIFTGNSKQQGKFPAGLQRMIDELLKPKVNWQALLAKYVSPYLQPVDWTYQKLHRKSQVLEVPLPNILRESCEIEVVVDTSGSIGQEALTEFISEIVGMARSMRHLDMHITFVDASVQARYKVDNGDIKKILSVEAKGGGGTSMEAGLDHIKQNNPAVPVVIVLTDGYDSYSRKVRDYPFNVIWCIAPGGQANQPYGYIVKMEG